MKDISKNIVEKIKKNRILPESRFRLRWKHYLFWMLMFIMILIGSLSLSMAIFSVSDLGTEFLFHTGLGKFVFIILKTAPYLWIMLSMGALIFGIIAFRNTSKGYRSSTLFITSLIVLVISILGFSIHALKIDNRMHRAILDRAPGFKVLIKPGEGRWLRPGDGLIGGEIVGIESDMLTLKSFDEKEWSITFDEYTKKINIEEFKIGEKVGVMGKKTAEFSMRASFIRALSPDRNGHPLRIKTKRDMKRLERMTPSDLPLRRDFSDPKKHYLVEPNLQEPSDIMQTM